MLSKTGITLRLRRLVDKRQRPCSSRFLERNDFYRARARWSCSQREEGRIETWRFDDHERTTHAGERVKSRSMIDSLAATCSKTAMTFELADIRAAVDVSTSLESRLNIDDDDFWHYCVRFNYHEKKKKKNE